MPLAPKPVPDSRRRTPQNRAAHYALIATSTIVALAAGAWLMTIGRG